MPKPATQRIIRAYRQLQWWPLLYLAAAIVGFIICASGFLTGRETWIRFGLWFTVPLFLLIGWLVMVLTISILVNTGLLLWRLMKR